MILETPKGHDEEGEDLDARQPPRAPTPGRAILQPTTLTGVAADEEEWFAMSDPQLNGARRERGSSPPRPPRLDPGLFINRELSWLDFNERVLEEARDPSNPLLDRLRFLAICASNLDEFFEVRVAGLQAQLYDNLEPQDTPPDGMGPLTQLAEIARRAHDFVARQYETWQHRAPPRAGQPRHPASAAPTS